MNYYTNKKNNKNMQYLKCSDEVINKLNNYAEKYADFVGINRIEDIDTHLLNNTVFVNGQVDEKKLDYLITEIKNYVISIKKQEEK